MTSVSIIHRHEPGHGWFFTSPELPGLMGSDVSYVAAKERAEDAARFHLTCEAEEQDLPAPDLDALEFEHFVPASEAPSLAA